MYLPFVADAHPNLRHDNSRDAPAGVAPAMDQLTTAGRDQCLRGLLVLLELGAAGAFHKLPMIPRPDADILSQICNMVRLGRVKPGILGFTAIQFRQAATIDLVRRS